LTHIERGDI